MKLIDLLTSEERQQLRVRYDDASFPDYVNELLNKEVKHGQWKKRLARGGFHEDWGYTCSECGVEFIDLHPAHYCPNCGAYMD